MNGKILTNGLLAGLALQQICEIDGCTRKAEYSITRWRGNTMLVCTEHFPHVDELDAMFGEALK